MNKPTGQGLTFRLNMAKRQGEKQVEEEGITSLPVDPIKVAENHAIVVDNYSDVNSGVSGMLLRHGDSFGIFYSTNIPNKGFQRFSIGHELGHYFLEGHLDQISFQDGFHSSQAGFASVDAYEQEADSFATGLLMPARLFRRAINNFEDGLPAINGLASFCQTSLTATAIRYVELTEAAVAIVMSTEQVINYVFMSTPLKSLCNLVWLGKGQPVPKGTLTSNYNADKTRFRNQESIDIDLRDWLGGTRSIDAIEEVVSLGSYGKTLTVLSCPEVQEATYGDEDEDDASFTERWTPRFSRK